VWGAGALLGLFLVQFGASIALSDDLNRLVLLVLSGVYLAGAAFLFVRDHRPAREVLHNGLTADLKKIKEF
jgi:hypothetical protein